MAISHPRLLPLMRFEECTFLLDPGVATARHARGRAGTSSQVRDALWFAKFETARLSVPDSATWQAWVNTQRGGLNLFLAWDVFRSEPLAYPAGVPEILAATWDGEASVTSLATPGEITLGGVPAGYQATAGDRIGLVQSGRYGYFEISASAVADGLGGLSVEVQPLVPEIFTTAAVAVLRRPLVALKLDWQSVSAPALNDPGPVSFSAAQVL